jgi:hypothetical protein
MTKAIFNIQTGETSTAEDDVRVITEEETAVERIEKKEDLKASAKAKLINGEPLTEEEADTIVL